VVSFNREDMSTEKESKGRPPATTSAVTGGIAAGLNSFASGNMTAVKNFNFSQLESIAATASASRIPVLKPWADRIGDLYGKLVDVTAKAKEACR